MQKYFACLIVIMALRTSTLSPLLLLLFHFNYKNLSPIDILLIESTCHYICHIVVLLVSITLCKIKTVTLALNFQFLLNPIIIIIIIISLHWSAVGYKPLSYCNTVSILSYPLPPSTSDFFQRQQV